MEDKMEYEAPTLTEVGAFEEVTQGSASGPSTDASFAGGTATTDLGFS